MEVSSLVIFFGFLFLLVLIILFLWWLLRSNHQSKNPSPPISYDSGLPVTSPPSTRALSDSVSQCQTDTDCYSGSDERSLACVSGQCQLRSCRVNEDCLLSETCFNGKCVPQPPTPTIPCQTRDQCPPETPHCVSGQCRSIPASPPPNALIDHDTCTSDADCSTGNCIDSGTGVKYCNKIINGCFFNYTGSDGIAVCPADRPYCIDGICSTTPGAHPCLNSSQCAPGSKCINGKCQQQLGSYGDLCSTNSDCGSGLQCNRICVPINYKSRRTERRNLKPIQLGSQVKITDPSRPTSFMGTGCSTSYLPLSIPNIQYPNPIPPTPVQTMGTGYSTSYSPLSIPNIQYPNPIPSTPVQTMGTGNVSPSFDGQKINPSLYPNAPISDLPHQTYASNPITSLGSPQSISTPLSYQMVENQSFNPPYPRLDNSQVNNLGSNIANIPNVNPSIFPTNLMQSNIVPMNQQSMPSLAEAVPMAANTPVGSSQNVRSITETNGLINHTIGSIADMPLPDLFL